MLALATLLLLGGCGDDSPDTGSAGKDLVGSSLAHAPAPSAAALGPFPDANGQWASFSLTTPLLSNAFFSALGTNPRTCATCHVASDAWSATPGTLQALFASSAGTAPIFNSVDGTNCGTPIAKTLPALQAASSELLNKGLIRIVLPLPAGAQFKVTSVSNPYGCNSQTSLSLYRRILPTANLGFVSTVMWDGRASFGQPSIQAALIKQAGQAITSHEQAASLPAAATLQSIVAFESALFSTQTSTNAAGSLSGNGAAGGPVALSAQRFVAGSNDPFAAATNPEGVPPGPVFTLFKAWENLTATDPVSQAEESIGRGEVLFNTLRFPITLVGGLNDTEDAGGRPRTTVTGTCGTCHNTPNAGSNSTNRLFNTGVAAPNPNNPDLPVITLTEAATGAQIETTDPGYALTTGQWADVGKFKVPTLRNLAARPPFFHNGGAPNLQAVVNFYNKRFNLNLTPRQQSDLVNFLGAL